VKLALAALATAACTTLGPVPATTAISARPEVAPAGEVQIAFVPGYFLSQGTAKDPKGASIGQLALTFDPGRWLPGLVVGFRAVGPSHDTQGEPMIGYRREVADGRAAVAAFVHGTHASAEHEGASYEATRIGAELATDVRLTREHRWVELHAIGAIAAQHIRAEGTYCLDADLTYGVKCGEPPENLTSADAKGLYPAATAGLAVHVLRRRGAVLHGIRVLAMISAGAMPRVVASEQTDATGWLAIGLGASVAFGGR
jgi:hypothetical protein